MLTTISRRLFSKSVPIVDIEGYLKQNDSSVADCAKVAQALHEYGLLIIKDPRVRPADNDKFLDMMERYF